MTSVPRVGLRSGVVPGMLRRYVHQRKKQERPADRLDCE
jgi:hypothetical protein